MTYFPVSFYYCEGGTGALRQQFQFDDTLGQIYSPAKKLCVDVGSDGVRLTLNFCNATKVSQKWQYSPEEKMIKWLSTNAANVVSKCIDDSGTG